MKAGGLATFDPISGSQGVQILPLELWNHIFHHIPWHSRQPITLVCQTFRWLAQPLLFENLGIGITWNTLGTLDDRLEFITSPRIASVVLVCRLTHTLGHLVDPKFSDIVLNALPRFSKLVYLRLDGFRITNSLLETISGFRRPPDLHILNAAYEVDDSPPLKHPIPLLYLKSGGMLAQNPILATTSPILVHPTHTHTLILEHGIDTILRRLVNTGSVFALRSLTIRRGNTLFPEFAAFLNACPALEELRLHVELGIAYLNSSHTFGEPSKTALPRLRVFQGPSFMVEAFTRDRPVAHLVVWGFNEKDLGMIQMLASQGARYPIESLSLYIGKLTNAVAGALTTMSVIRALSLVMEQHQSWQKIYSIVKAMNIPSTLEHLTCHTFRRRRIGKALLPLFPKEKYPRLQYLCDCDSMSYNPATGEVVEFDSIEHWRRNALGLYRPLIDHYR